MEGREQKGSGAGCVIFMAVLVLLPVFYVLSISPAALLADSYLSTQDWLGPIYFPLGYLAEYCPPFDDALT